jgi:mono/diheme cytochrome c family protein
MSNRPKRKPSRSTPVAAPRPDSSVAGRVVVIVAAVVLALALAGTVWAVTRGGTSEPELDARAAHGKQVAINNGCVSCHSADGDVSEGPTWKGLYGQPVVLTSGATITADDAYLRRAIREPGAEVVQGYRPLMPTKTISDDDLAALIAYLEALR